MIFSQIQEHGEQLQLHIADEETLEAAVVDSSYNADAIIKAIKKNNLQLRYIINTHGHSEPHSRRPALKKAFSTAKTVAHKQSPRAVDFKVDDGSKLEIGAVTIQVIYTPVTRQTNMPSNQHKEKLLTGDTLFVGNAAALTSQAVTQSNSTKAFLENTQTRRHHRSLSGSRLRS